MADPAPKQKRPLEEVMLAMDVVDTLRHRENLVARELNEEERDRQLIARLREIYASQGIEVTDAILAEGVEALKEQRFVYTPPEPSFSVSLARLYVRRHAWGKAALGIVAAVAIAWGAWHFLVTVPAEQRAEARQIELTQTLPKRLETLSAAIESGSQAPEASRMAQSIRADGDRALAENDLDGARSAVAQLEDLRGRLDQEYVLRIVSRPGATSGLWRIPEANPDARNYYLIVEALNRRAQPVTVSVTNEETGKAETVTQWAVRVPETTFNSVRRDKEDDGIIQEDILGAKRRGTLEPDYAMPVSGGAITDW
ncbi:DUF6384 family protein [Microbaculum marinisediminis]|uniref:DUF6384 family protein n=1 Tax=Microbaculum marinisediminis TaxID=2931392 RepID=A0AAW5QSG9_9HYPH|nr:DUF6384 family protein [Microbaculum sp. A6E488]MCT8970991.1 DUF6384 family protein [Microbaculum sp. A6E488]